MKAEEARELVKQYNEEKAQEELNKTVDNIRKAATLGKTAYFTSFKYEKNVDKVKELGYTVKVRSKVPNEAEQKYESYYDITWDEV